MRGFAIKASMPEILGTHHVQDAAAALLGAVHRPVRQRQDMLTVAGSCVDADDPETAAFLIG